MMNDLQDARGRVHAKAWDDEDILQPTIPGLVYATHVYGADKLPYVDTQTEWFSNMDSGSIQITLVRSSGEDAGSADTLQQRLANANDHFRRKASEVLNDEAAMDLLATMYRDIVVDISSFDSCENGIPLAKLAAANFCEVGAKVIYITEAGQLFIDSLRANGRL